MTPCPNCGWPHYDPAEAIPCEPCATEASAQLRTVVGNLLDKYGTEGVRELLRRFQALESNDKIASDFGVSGERVRQWQHILGTVEREWTPDPAMVGLAGAHGWSK